jgi:hypothetical protein
MGNSHGGIEGLDGSGQEGLDGEQLGKAIREKPWTAEKEDVGRGEKDANHILLFFEPNKKVDIPNQVVEGALIPK